MSVVEFCSEKQHGADKSASFWSLEEKRKHLVGGWERRRKLFLECMMRTETPYPWLSCQTRKWGLNSR